MIVIIICAMLFLEPPRVIPPSISYQSYIISNLCIALNLMRKGGQTPSVRSTFLSGSFSSSFAFLKTYIFFTPAALLNSSLEALYKFFTCKYNTIVHVCEFFPSLLNSCDTQSVTSFWFTGPCEVLSDVNTSSGCFIDIVCSPGPFFEPCNVQTTSEISMNLSWSTAKSTLPVTYFYQIVNQSIFSTSSLSTSIQRLTPGTTYYFNVWANSASSNSETVTCGGSTSNFFTIACLYSIFQIQPTKAIFIFV